MQFKNEEIGTAKTIGVKLPCGKSTSVRIPADVYSLAAVGFGGVKQVSAMARAIAGQFQASTGKALTAFVVDELAQSTLAAMTRQTNRLAAKRGLQLVNAQSYVAAAPSDSPFEFASGPVDLNDPALQSLTKPLAVATIRFQDYDLTWVVMPWTMFHELPDCPYQRNTAAHAKKASHLVDPSPFHAQVAASLLNGELSKLDAHSRDYLQSLGKLKKPGALMCAVVHCKTREEIRKFYDQFDNLSAAEKANEKLFGLFRSQGITQASPFMREGAYKSALQVGIFGEPKPRTPDSILLHSQEILPVVDELMLDAKKSFKATVAGAVISAAMKLVKENRTDKLASLREFVKRISTKSYSDGFNTGAWDAADVLLVEMAIKRNRGGMSGQAATYQLSLGALHLWLNEVTHITLNDLKELSKKEFDELDIAGKPLKVQQPTIASVAGPVSAALPEGLRLTTGISRTVNHEIVEASPLMTTVSDFESEAEEEAFAVQALLSLRQGADSHSAAGF